MKWSCERILVNILPLFHPSYIHVCCPLTQCTHTHTLVNMQMGLYVLPTQQSRSLREREYVVCLFLHHRLLLSYLIPLAQTKLHYLGPGVQVSVCLCVCMHVILSWVGMQDTEDSAPGCWARLMCHHCLFSLKLEKGPFLHTFNDLDCNFIICHVYENNRKEEFN